MWKKFVVTGIALISTFSVAFIVHQDMSANSNGSYNTGGEVAGVLKGGFKKEDQIAINSNSLTYRLLADVSQARGIENSWYSITNGALLDSVQFHSVSSVPAIDYFNADFFKHVSTFNNSMSTNDKLIMNNWSWQKQDIYDTERYTFVPRYHDFYDSDRLGYQSSLSNGDLAYSKKYWTTGATGRINEPGRDAISTQGSYAASESPLNSNALRLCSVFDFNDVVFALGINGNTNTEGLTNIRTQTRDDVLNVRIEDTSLKVNFDKITNGNSENEISKLSKGGIVVVNYSGASVGANNKLSLLIMDDAGTFKNYEQFDLSTESGKLDVDISNLDKGKYKIHLVVENIITTNGPSRASALNLGKTLEIVTPLSELTHTPSHTSSGMDYYFSTNNGNVLASNKVASLSTQNGVGSSIGENGIVYKLQPSSISSNIEDYKSFVIPTESGTDKPVLDSKDGKPYVIAKPVSGDFLAPGVYKYRVQAYDTNGDPIAYEASDTSRSNPYAQLNDGTIVKGITPSQGLITEDITTVVYPHESQMTYAQLKDANGEFYRKNDINNSGFSNHLGTLTFEADANMQKLFDAGYSINTTTSKLMKKGSTTEQLTMFKVTADITDKSKFYIDKKSNVESGTYEFDAWVYFKNNNGDTALLKLSNQSMFIAPSLSFVNPDKATEVLTSDTYERKYNAYASTDNHENVFTLVASDKTDLSSNSAVKYCIYDEVNKACSASYDSDVLTLADNGNGTASITSKQYHKVDPDAIVRAYLEDGKGGMLSYQDITIKINRSERKMKWEGKGIGSLNKDVIAKGNDYQVTLPYDSASPTEYEFSRILRDVPTPAAGVLALRHDEGTGIVDSTMGGSLTKGINSDSFKLTNKCTGTSCFVEISKEQDDLFESGTVKLYIVSEDMKPIEDAQVSWNYNEDDSWKVASGTILTDYEKDGVVPVRIDHGKLPTDIANVKIVYSLQDTANANTITVANKIDSDSEGEMSILQANQTGNNAYIKAVITSDNYAQKGVTIPVKINKLNQTIDFNKVFHDLASSIKVDESTNYNYEAVLQVDETTAGKGTISYVVSGTPVDMLTNNSENSTFTVTKAGKVTVTATLTDDKNYTSTNKTVTKTITYYADAGLEWTQNTTLPEALNTIDGGTTGDADVNKEIGNILVDGGKSAAYSFSVDGSKHSDDSTYFSIVLNSDKKSGKLKIIKKIDAAALHAHATQVGTGDTYEWVIHAKAIGTVDTTDVTESDIKITFTGAKPDISFTNAVNKKITDSYELDKAVDLSVKRGSSSISDPTLTISGYTSALSLNADGVSASIKGANTDNNDAVRSGRKIEVSAEVKASAGYKTGTSSLQEVIIKKVAHPTIEFNQKILSSSNNVDAILSGILHNNGKFNEDVLITPIRLSDEDSWIIEPYSVSKDEAYEEPTIAISPKGYLGTIDFSITASGNDNYKPLPENTKTTLEFSEDGGIVYKPISVVYGDKTKNVLDFIVSPNPDDDPDSVTYAYSGYDTDVITVGSDGKITPIKAGTTTLSFKRSDSADNSEMEQNIKVTIKPKDIAIYVNDLHKKVGEVVSVTDYTIDTNKSTAFEIGDDVGTLAYSCQDNNVEVTTLVNGLLGPAPKVLAITTVHTGGEPSKKANYAITYHPGNLNITQDEGQASWVSVVPKGDTTLKDNWYNGDVEIKLNAIAGDYSEISPDGNAPWSTTFTISEEGKLVQEIAFRNGVTLAKAKSITKDINIDTTAPSVEKITAKSSNNKLEDILNAVTFGTFFKPGTQFNVSTKDSLSGTSSLTYSIYRIEKNNSETELEKDKEISVKDETGVIKISDKSGTYKVCTKATDVAGNTSATESCATVKIGHKDMNIPTGDNDCPDINLDFNDDGIAELNIDVDGNKIPDMNIDSDFDGKADINVDSDQDLKPDLNLIKLSEWTVGICSVVGDKTYATMEGIEPIINVVVDNGTDEIKDQMPSLNIDNKGDFKPHLNISKDGKKAYLNITKIHEWKPIHEYNNTGFIYDSIGTDKGEPFPEIEIDSDDDGYPDINVDLNNDGTPDLNIDGNYDNIPDLNIDGNGDGIPDYNLDADENGIPKKNIIKLDKWEPKKDVSKDGKEYDTMEIKGKNELEDNGVKVEKPDGEFLPNYSIKVTDAKDTVSNEEKEKINEFVDEGKEIKDIFDVNLYDGETIIQPDGTLKVRLPLKASYHEHYVKVIIEKADGTFEEVDATMEDGYLVYETSFLGKVSVISDKEEDVILPELPNASGGSTPNTSVKGNYTGSFGGAGTGDTSNIFAHMIILLCMCGCVCYMTRNYVKRGNKS